MSHIDVMKQALEALEQWNTPLYKRGNVITALRRALEQPAPATELRKQELVCIDWDTKTDTPIFARPQAREPLTDEEIVQLSQEWPPETNDWASHIDFARAIEAAHGITGASK